jgi:hypothetical protein
LCSFPRIADNLHNVFVKGLRSGVGKCRDIIHNLPNRQREIPRNCQGEATEQTWLGRLTQWSPYQRALANQLVCHARTKGSSLQAPRNGGGSRLARPSCRFRVYLTCFDQDTIRISARPYSFKLAGNVTPRPFFSY